MSGYAVRKHYMKEFQGLTKQSRPVASAIVGFYVVQTVAAMCLGYWMLGLPMTNWTIASLAVIMVFIATRFRGFNNIVHECSHYTFSDHRPDNTFWGAFCASMVLSCFQSYRDEHMTHHAHLGDYDKDMDLHGIKDLHLEDPLNAKTIFRHIMTPLVGLHLPYYLGVNLSGADGRGFLWMKYGLIAAAVVFLMVDPLSALVLVWGPFCFLYSAMNYWTDCVDHAGLIESGDELEASRNFLALRTLQPILFPRNDCYHLVHHLFPQVPSRHFGECHEKLLEHPAYLERTTRGWTPADDLRPAEQSS